MALIPQAVGVRYFLAGAYMPLEKCSLEEGRAAYILAAEVEVEHIPGVGKVA